MSRKSSCKLSRHGWLFRSFVLLQANLARANQLTFKPQVLGLVHFILGGGGGGGEG